MQTCTLPGTDLALSRVGLGCWTIGRLWWGEDHDDGRAVRTVHAALDAGINWVDTAPLYGHGHADRLLRTALQGRSDVYVATKVGVRWEGDHAVSDLRPAHVVADAEASLTRLGRERLDLLQVHWPCQTGTPIAATMEALTRLVEAGKVGAIGLCNFDAAALAQARAVAPVTTLQTPLSLLRREYESRLAAEVQRPVGEPPLPVACLAYETLCRGLLAGRFTARPRFPDTDLRSRDDRFRGHRFDHARALVGDLERAARRVGLPVATLAVGWVLSRPGVACAVVGARRPEQIVETAAAAGLGKQQTL
ncbi:MAG: aldo/keto reductase [Myxococcota bacterium]|nr:aldo/keto reductase [Myxococcota bacterium]